MDKNSLTRCLLALVWFMGIAILNYSCYTRMLGRLCQPDCMAVFSLAQLHTALSLVKQSVDVSRWTVQQLCSGVTPLSNNCHQDLTRINGCMCIGLHNGDGSTNNHQQQQTALQSPPLQTRNVTLLMSLRDHETTVTGSRCKPDGLGCCGSICNLCPLSRQYRPFTELLVACNNIQRLQGLALTSLCCSSVSAACGQGALTFPPQRVIREVNVHRLMRSIHTPERCYGFGMLCKH